MVVGCSVVEAGGFGDRGAGVLESLPVDMAFRGNPGGCSGEEKNALEYVCAEFGRAWELKLHLGMSSRCTCSAFCQLLRHLDWLAKTRA